MSSNTCSALFPDAVVSRFRVKNRKRLASGGLRTSFPLSLLYYQIIALKVCITSFHTNNQY